MSSLAFNNHFVKELPADPIQENYRRQVTGACYSFATPTPVKGAHLISYAREVADLIGLSEQDCQSEWFLNTFSGNAPLEGMQPHAMCYGGHQFGNWAGQLGDGRAMVLGDVQNQAGENWSLQLKGAGPTPYSRTADGLAVLRSSIREYLCSEAMHHLGVPTTRALSLIGTGEDVLRDIMYNGNEAYEPGAVVCRVAPSFIRFGNFQLLSARKEFDLLKQLADYTIRHHFAHLVDVHEVGSKEIYLAWFEEVCDRTVTMIVDWMRLGFVHGVMNTDNMSIHGLTIDYGPYGWLDSFDPEWTPNTTDAQNRRYRYSQQPNIALWNCYQLANALYPLIEETEGLEAILQEFQAKYQQRWNQMMASKLGLLEVQDGDQALFETLEAVLQQEEVDMTLFYRALATTDFSAAHFQESFYREKPNEGFLASLTEWLGQYQARLALEDRDQANREQAMNKVNPLYVFRNYIAQQAIDKAEAGDFEMVNQLLEVLRQPYTQQDGMEHFAEKRPDWARTKVGCSMLSCSS